MVEYCSLVSKVIYFPIVFKSLCISSYAPRLSARMVLPFQPCLQNLNVTKPQKRFPALKGIFVILTFVMITSAYICLFYLNQKGLRIRPKLIAVQVLEEEAYGNLTHPTYELPRLHYPKPSTYTRNECVFTPVRYFAIISMQRSGSGWFETLLNSHINISSNGEIFSVKERRGNLSVIMATLDKVYNLDWYSSASKNECTGAVGFKWMLNQGLTLYLEDIVEYFRRRGVSSVFLIRKNLLRRWVSLLANSHDRKARQLNGTHKAHVHSMHQIHGKSLKPKFEKSCCLDSNFILHGAVQAEVLARFKPVIDVKSLILDMKQTNKWSAHILQYFKGTRHVVLYYEDLVRNKTKMMDVLDFLRIPHGKLTSRHVKIHTKPLSDQIENWDVVSQTLKGTEYETFLHSDYQKK